MPRTADANACRTCIRRRLKCDGKLPICQRCEKRDIYCDRTPRLLLRQYNPGEQTAQTTISDPKQDLEQVYVAQLFHVYIKELAPWYDLNDEERAFEREGAEKALSSPLLFAAAIAFAGIYMHRKAAFPRSVAEMYHDRCLKLLIALSGEDPGIRDGTALASTCLLRSYELLAEENDPNRHLFGASTLVPSLPSLADHSLLTSGFWNYLREDISYSLFSDCPLKVSMDQVCLLEAHDDEFANHMTLLLARTVNVFYGKDEDDVLPEIHAWRRRFTRQPFSRTQGKVFPVVKMLKDCQVAAIHYYYVALCMLDESDRRPGYAAEIVGLSMAAESTTVTINAYGPMCYSGQYLTSGEQRQALIAYLLSTERKTQWSVGFIVSTLKKKWELSDAQARDIASASTQSAEG
jgi:hypothetical protein